MNIISTLLLGIQRVLVTIMTGKPDDDVTLPSRKLKDSCVLSFGVGLGPTLNKPEIKKLVSEPLLDFTITANEHEEKRDLAATVVEKINKGKMRARFSYPMVLVYKSIRITIFEHFVCLMKSYSFFS